MFTLVGVGLERIPTILPYIIIILNFGLIETIFV